MPPVTLRRNTAILALAMALALPWAALAAPQAPRHQPAAHGFLHQLWTAISGFWSAGMTADSGCHWDPDGHCVPGSAAPAPNIVPDSGCHWDPSGNCFPGSAAPAPTIAPDTGCHMDPSGNCVPGS